MSCKVETKGPGGKTYKPFNSFKIAKNYMSVTLWLCNKSGECMDEIKMTPNKDLTRQLRFDQIKSFLNQFGLKIEYIKSIK